MLFHLSIFLTFKDTIFFINPAHIPKRWGKSRSKVSSKTSGRYDAKQIHQSIYLRNSWPTTPVMEGMTTTFPLYDSYYDIENGDQCSLMTGQIEIVYFNPVGAMKK